MIYRAPSYVPLFMGVGVMAMCAIAVFAISIARPDPCHELDSSRPLSVATVHFMDWDILTRRSLSVTDLRRRKGIKKRIKEPVALLCLSNLIADSQIINPTYTPQDLNGRLLIEGIDTQGKTANYFADQFQICSLDRGVCRDVDKRFRLGISKMMREQ